MKVQNSRVGFGHPGLCRLGITEFQTVFNDRVLGSFLIAFVVFQRASGNMVHCRTSAPPPKGVLSQFIAGFAYEASV